MAIASVHQGVFIDNWWHRILVLLSEASRSPGIGREIGGFGIREFTNIETGMGRNLALTERGGVINLHAKLGQWYNQWTAGAFDQMACE
jgi:hypothetical protein